MLHNRRALDNYELSRIVAYLSHRAFMDEIRNIIEKITEHYETPVRVGSLCETSTFYRLEDLRDQDLSFLATYIAERIFKVCHPSLPSLLISMPGGYTGLVDLLARELADEDSPLEVVGAEVLSSGNGKAARLKNLNTVIVTDVITTARSCIEAHTKATMYGANVLCWACVIDRTFGPGPVPVVAAHTGAPVQLLERP